MKNLLIDGVRSYQRFISPGLPVRYRYYPMCSQYMIDTIHAYGSVRGTTMGVVRVLRCHPFVEGGIDHVPLKLRLTKNPDETYHGPCTYRGSKKTEAERDG